MWEPWVCCDYEYGYRMSGDCFRKERKKEDYEMIMGR